MSTEWFKISDEDKGKEFTIIQPCKLHGMKSIGPYTWQGTQKELKENDTIIYLGMANGWGSDNIPQHYFKSGDFKGTLSCAPFEGWGSISIGYIKRK